MEDHNSKKTKSHPNALVKPIISLARLIKDELEVLEHINYMCHNTPILQESTKSKSQDLILALLRSGSSLWT